MFYPEIILPPVGNLSAFLLCLTPLEQAQARHLKISPANAFIRTVSVVEEIKVTGTIRDKQGSLPGATIIVKNTNRGTTADEDGQFCITVNRNETLVISMLGYQNVERVVDNAQIDIIMTVDAKQLSEVVVGYGATTQGDVTGAISSVKSGDFNAGVNFTPDQLLQGKVAGLNVTRSGDPNANASIILRGSSTLRTTAAQEPFYVIDGVPGASIQVVAPNNSISIDVLKDASSTAIYGSRSANGVIMVKRIYPSPATERSLNPNLTQNPGY